MLSAGVVAAFGLYSFLSQWRATAAPVPQPVAAAAAPSPAAKPVAPPPVRINRPSPTETAVSPAPSQTATAQSAAPSQTGKFKNGTYTGSAADAYFGTVQVQAVVSGGRLADVNILQYPSDRGTSRYISSMSLPTLKSEAIRSQSANVDAVSGATQTSDAFTQSLGDALAKAAN